MDGCVCAGEGQAECPAGARGRLREPAGEIFPEGCAWPPTLLCILSLPLKDLAWPRNPSRAKLALEVSNQRIPEVKVQLLKVCL